MKVKEFFEHLRKGAQISLMGDCFQHAMVFESLFGSRFCALIRSVVLVAVLRTCRPVVSYFH